MNYFARGCAVAVLLMWAVLLAVPTEPSTGELTFWQWVVGCIAMVSTMFAGWCAAREFAAAKPGQASEATIDALKAARRAIAVNRDIWHDSLVNRCTGRFDRPQDAETIALYDRLLEQIDDALRAEREGGAA